MPLVIEAEHLKPYKIMAIDPGSNFLGVSIFGLNYDLSINSVYSRTLDVSGLPESINSNPDIQSERTSKLLKIENEISRILMYENPLAVICEAPFYNRLRPGAFEPLVQVISVINNSIIRYDSNIPFISIEPSVVKKAVGAGYICGKEEMKEAVFKIQEIIAVLTVDYNRLDEHSIDSIAVGYAFISNERNRKGK